MPRLAERPERLVEEPEPCQELATRAEEEEEACGGDTRGALEVLFFWAAARLRLGWCLADEGLYSEASESS